MRDTRSLLRLTAVVLVSVLVLTLAAPSRAEADVLLAAGIAGLVVIVVIVVVYLVVASTRGPRMGSEESPSRVACLEADGVTQRCWAVAGTGMPPALPEGTPQS